MINREELLEMCGRDAPEVDTWAEEEASAREVCGEISLEGSRFCVLDIGHTGPHAYETRKPPVASNVSPTTQTGLVLHCKRCKSPLTTPAKSTKTGYWCDHCCYPPSLDDTYLAKPRPNFKPQPDNPFENDTIDHKIQNLLGYFLG
jgi:hypothetical protein